VRLIAIDGLRDTRDSQNFFVIFRANSWRYFVNANNAHTNIQTNTESKIPAIGEGVGSICLILSCDGFIGGVASEWLAVVALLRSFRPILHLGDRRDDRS
jgi:hypothetical protein